MINSLDPNYKIIGSCAKKDKYLFGKPEKFFKSPRLSFIFRYTDPLKNPEAFRDDIIRACEAYKADLLIPTGTIVTNYLSYFKKEISQHVNTKLLVECYEKLRQLADKWDTYNLCIKLGIPTPKTALLERESNVEFVVNSFSFPVVIKPRHSYASKGIHFFQNSKALKEYIFKKRILNNNYILQEVISGGELHDVALCAKEGKTFSILTQQRLVSFYDFGGGGIINKTTYEPQLMEYAKKIAKYMNWNGLLEIDFIFKDNKYYLLECNPKVWGTTYLTTKAGLNMIQQMVDMLAFNKQTYFTFNYEVGLLYKWIFPECFASWFQKPRTIKRILRRFLNTFRNYNAKRTLINLNFKDIPHLIGIVLDKTEI